MFTFYWSLLREIPSAFRNASEAWMFWGLTVVVAVVFWINPSWRPLMDAPAFSRLFGVVPIGLAVLYGLLRANYNRFVAKQEAIDSLAARVDQLQREIAEAKEPQLSGRFEQTMSADVVQMWTEEVNGKAVQRNKVLGVVVHVNLTIVNRGAPTTIDRWKLRVRHHGRNVEGRLTVIDDRTNLSGEDGSSCRINAADAIYERASTAPLARGGRISGWLRADFPGEAKNDLMSAGAVWEVTCMDYLDKVCTLTFAYEGNEQMEHPKYIPGGGAVRFGNDD